MLWRNACIIVCCIWLAGCGFTPLYSTSTPRNTSSTQHMMATKIAPIPGRIGQQLHGYLSDLINPRSSSVPKAYRLSVQLEKSIAPVGIEQDRRITRYNLTLRANYTLTDIKSGKVVDKGHVRLIGSYDSVDSDFATFVAEEDSTEHLLREMSESLKSRLAVSFLHHNALENENEDTSSTK